MENQNSRLTITFIVGSDPYGDPVFTTKSFQNVKGEAADVDLVQFVQSFVSLQSLELDSATRTNQYGLI
ncbi:hypothetical protein AJ85_20970 [Alkalihalobacillus alcalophilus ATCC 27647 = CGMCC 1.3604]|uniref:DUF1659 domain-containing protein n=1 Tax=Alkalihalobacillus alcalophilus ATCC 27647 = CGMCC 1.3604 TaxID=1218173 RepID=A0A094XDG5_ALKAL|nr:DUF1659 domain-containing protein [Alkalihalobacillus alcalophilus]KGA96810.1 hypothetical protein BALCAV_0213820 [Alkalihalobacillus alcalophilus ATCC 27647 = CGMCC 1.3604]MED1561197.1 DUF1659 domain-containing protein [Alkalihalobacillus alcalophilus]THG88873.1 hypothetical protein AJ85_20970 [Alkalihalobacillus alcalophilus ATCC 27647 = CGMCC 1.3604]